jgi:glycosyltransferase involved in cell wall biosynthesis
LQPHKNLPGILKAFELLRSDYGTECQLVVVGKKQSYFYDATIDQKYLDDPNIRFTGYISDEELGQLYQQAEAFVYPSFEEGFGMPLVEAFYAGCPVITSDCSCLPEIAGDAAVLTDPNDASTIADALATVTTNSSFRKELVSRGRVRAQRYRWENAARQVHDQLKRLAA